MEEYSTTDPSQQLNSLIGGNSGEPLIPESLTTFLIISFVVLNLLSIVFLILWIMGMMRRWKVQTAILHMQKDIVEIKESLAKSVEPAPVPTSNALKPETLETENKSSEQNSVN